MKVLKGKSLITVVSLVLLMVGAFSAPIPVSANKGSIEENPFFGEAEYVGNIYELTGVEKTTSNLGLVSYKERASRVDSLLQETEYSPGENVVVGTASLGGADLVFVYQAGDVVELMFFEGKIYKYVLKHQTLGSWTSPDGATTLKVGYLETVLPESIATEEVSAGEQSTLWVYFFSHAYRYPLTGNPAYWAEVIGYLNDEQTAFTSAVDNCAPLPGGSYLVVYEYSTSTNYVSYVYAGGDAYFKEATWFFPDKVWHGAWVTVDTQGNASHGGY